VADFDVRTADLRALNSMTKYPSIPTYHALDPKNGNLLEDPVRFTGHVIATEKVDGTNGRIILLPDGTYLIGSRETLLYAKGDLIGDATLGIVDALRPIADGIDGHVDPSGAVQVLYVEVYGGKVTPASKQYTSTGRVGARLFDSAVIPDAVSMLDWPVERIASWRDAGGQSFLDEDDLDACVETAGVALAPRLFTMPAAEVPTDVEGMAKALADWLPVSTVGIDRDGGRPEGVVLRTADRAVIAKARFQDYERTLRRRK
jgi:hypothetical protein